MLCYHSLKRKHFWISSKPAIVVFDSGATYSLVSRLFSNHLGRNVGRLFRPMVVRVADNRTLQISDVYHGCTLEISGIESLIDLISIDMKTVCVHVDMDRLDTFEAEIPCHRMQVRVHPKWGEN